MHEAGVPLNCAERFVRRGLRASLIVRGEFLRISPYCLLVSSPASRDS